jgi:NADPH:quinone reductase-like Zn-dependent oxidoreductase
MLAIQYDRFGPPDVLQLVDLPVPPCGPRDVLVHLRAASVIPGDCKLRAGHLKAVFAVEPPKIPGRDGAGVVAEVGSEVTDLRVGDRVCVVSQHVEPGTYAQAIVRDRESVVPLPAGLGFEEGAALMHAGVCAWICVVETAGIGPGMRLLVHAGAGAIGGAAIQIARQQGAFVAATCSERNLDYVASLGADLVIPYDRTEFSRAVGDIDVVLDLIGGEVHRKSYDVLKPAGHMVCLITAPFEDQSLRRGVRLSMAKIHDRPYALSAVASLAERGFLKPQISDVLPLSEAAEAHRRIEAQAVSRGRVVLSIPPIDGGITSGQT